MLDRGLPDGDGIQLCLHVRKTPALRGIPLLMLTGKSEAVDKVLGLRLGADDYLAKPFNVEELLARADALVRRAYDGAFTSSQISCAGIVIDTAGRRVLADGESVSLTAREYALLKALEERAGTVLSREFLLETVWGAAGGGKVLKTVDVTVMNLRRKLGRAGSRIESVRSEGYLLAKNLK